MRSGRLRGRLLLSGFEPGFRLRLELGFGSIDNAIGTQFSGGKPGAASSSATPVTIGMINQQGGQVSDPEASVAVRAAFSYINAEQDGIGGHPLKLSLCTIQSSEAQASSAHRAS